MDSSVESVHIQSSDRTGYKIDWFFVIHLPLDHISTDADRPPMPAVPFGTSCYICLDDNLTNKAFTNRCWHPFCFTCIKTWALKRASGRTYPQCPVCKRDFKSIHHTLQADSTPSWAFEVPHNNFFLSNRGEGCLFLKPTTFIPYLNNRWAYFHMHLTHLGISPPEGPGDMKGLRTIALKHQRLLLYYNNLWSIPLPNHRGEFMDCTPAKFRRDRFIENQLGEFIFREMRVLQVFLAKAHSVYLPNECVMEITSLLCVSLLAHSIHDEYIVGHFEKIFGKDLTKHFCYEFYNFVCSGFSMTDYDLNVKTTTVLTEIKPVYDPIEGVYNSSIHPKRRKIIPARDLFTARAAEQQYQVSKTKILPYYKKINCDFGGKFDELGKNEPEEYFSLVVPGSTCEFLNSGITEFDIIWPIWIRRGSNGRDVYLPKQLEPAQSIMLVAYKKSKSEATSAQPEAVANPFHRRVFGVIKYDRSETAPQNIKFCCRDRPRTGYLGAPSDDNESPSSSSAEN